MGKDKGARHKMRTEQVELTVLCLIHNEDSYLLQDRVKKDWNGYTLPGGDISNRESLLLTQLSGK